ncbi:hypothetical protein B0J11DRAFT_530871 [Dendryphion nanum]|uniref:Zn(2)-C6 fungal-type domain-containing protein n=1 Tax=Dendryphion nanum TaxID=256645 RepID=A0A9P9DSC2_9PLEO|nr:hypothetical protein B0J11DRAFT_530871 [Dendryphion nanum]
MASESVDRTTRASAACAACRAKKHRCSGERPECAQCKASSVPCEWPTQQKRGPPKQYIQSLEARLSQTETALLALLSHVSTERLDVTFDGALLDRGIDHNSAVPSTILKQSAHWKEFPLDSLDAIRRWYKYKTSPILGDLPRTGLTESETILSQDDISGPIPSDGSSLVPNAQSEDPYPPRWETGLQAIENELSTSQALQFIAEEENAIRTGAISDTTFALPAHEFEEDYVMRTSDSVGEPQARSGESEKGTQERTSVLNLSAQFKNDYIW